MYATIEYIAGVYAGYLKVKGEVGCYYASGRSRMEVITKLLTYAKLDGFVK